MSEYLSDKKAKKAIIDIGQRMYVRAFVAANDGNISVKVGPNEVWATPTSVSKGFMKKSMLVKVDLDGNILEGNTRPSSEIKMHLRAYKENVRAVNSYKKAGFKVIEGKSEIKNGKEVMFMEIEL